MLQSAERLFAANAPYLQLPVHVLFTIPPALVFRVRLDDNNFMPMIKIREKDGAACEDGIAAARDLVWRRIPDEDLQALFGAAVELRIRDLILATGGYPRELVRVLRGILGSATPGKIVDEDLTGRVVQEMEDSLRPLISSQSFDWLASVAVEKYFTLESEDDRRAADYMFTNNIILRYRNAAQWFDLHPGVRNIPGVKEAIKRLQTPPETP